MFSLKKTNRVQVLKGKGFLYLKKTMIKYIFGIERIRWSSEDERDVFIYEWRLMYGCILTD